MCSSDLEYRRDEDWCGGGERQGTRGQPEHLIPLINKHMEQKEAFLKVGWGREERRMGGAREGGCGMERIRARLWLRRDKRKVSEKEGSGENELWVESGRDVEGKIQ